MFRKFRVSKLMTVLGLIGLLNACSAYEAANQPDAKNLSLLKPGTERAYLVAEFGKPVLSEIGRSGERSDIFTFVDGYHSANKAGRAIFHGAADVMTLGLWELIATPMEGHYSGKKMSVQVTYDKNDRVRKIVHLKTKKKEEKVEKEEND
jgi:outer membrane protein assembly factor BamE (lipoprotein component of BamABCDE complex)